MAFVVRATKEQPLANPAFVIANGGGADSNVTLKINGQTKTRGVDYRTGREVRGGHGWNLHAGALAAVVRDGNRFV